MSQSRGSAFLKILLFGGLGVLLAWLSLRSIPFDVLVSHFTHANYAWVLLALLIGFLSHLLRALRWNQLLQPLGYKVALPNALGAILIGYLFNLAVPRSGEVARCGIAQTYDGVPIQTSIGTVVLERIIDMVFLLLAFALTFLLEFDRIYTYASDTIFSPFFALSQKGWFYSALALLCVLGVAAFYFIFIRKPKVGVKPNKIASFVFGFVDGIKSITQIKNPILFIAYSAGIWILYYLMLYVGFFAFEGLSHVSPAAALAAFSFGTVAMIITPGGIGAYPIIIGNILALYGVSVDLGNSFGWIIWGAQTIMFIITGAISLFSLPILNRKKA